MPKPTLERAFGTLQNRRLNAVGAAGCRTRRTAKTLGEWLENDLGAGVLLFAKQVVIPGADAQGHTARDDERGVQVAVG